MLYPSGSFGDCVDRYLKGKPTAPGPIAEEMENFLYFLGRTEQGTNVFQNGKEALRCLKVIRIGVSPTDHGFLKAHFFIGCGYHFEMVFAGHPHISKIWGGTFPTLEQKTIKEIWPTVAAWRAKNVYLWRAFALAHERCDGSYCPFCLGQKSPDSEQHQCGL